MTQNLSNKVIKVTTLQPNKRSKDVTSPILLLLQRLGLASQEVDVFDKLTNEILETSMAMKR
jgi:hypothetical protein